jgi:predicted RNA binding protein YcfA (HicA-like mRNA interferase family)
MPLSGKEMLGRFQKAGWAVHHQNGSHVRVTKGSLRETIPMHKELAKGTEQKLLKSLEQGGAS